MTHKPGQIIENGNYPGTYHEVLEDGQFGPTLVLVMENGHPRYVPRDRA